MKRNALKIASHDHVLCFCAAGLPGLAKEQLTGVQQAQGSLPIIQWSSRSRALTIALDHVLSSSR